MNDLMARLVELASAGILTSDPIEIGEGLRAWTTDGSRAEAGPWAWVEGNIPESELKARVGFNDSPRGPVPIASGFSGKKRSFLVWPMSRLRNKEVV